MWPTTSSCATGRAPSWPSPPRTNGTGNSPRLTACPWCARQQPPDGFDGEAWTGDGVKINSGFLDGLDIAAAKERAIDWLEERGYRAAHGQLPPAGLAGVAPAVLGLPDPRRLLPRWTASSGCPRTSLPVLAPDDVEFLPTGESPLPRHPTFRHTTCPICGGPAERETDTMDTFVDSSWYFLRFCDPWSKDKPVRPRARPALHARRPVHRRNRARHLTSALCALLHRALIDVGLAPGVAREPFSRLFTQGMIRMDGKKMSKSRGNLVTPSRYFDTVGADALRLFHIFVGPPGDDMDWTEQTESVIEGCGRFLDRVWRLTVEEDSEWTGATATSPIWTGDQPGHAPADRQGERRHRAVVVQHGRRGVHGVLQRVAALPA